MVSYIHYIACGSRERLAQLYIDFVERASALCVCGLIQNHSSTRAWFNKNCSDFLFWSRRGCRIILDDNGITHRYKLYMQVVPISFYLHIPLWSMHVLWWTCWRIHPLVAQPWIKIAKYVHFWMCPINYRPTTCETKNLAEWLQCMVTGHAQRQFTQICLTSLPNQNHHHDPLSLKFNQCASMQIYHN